MGMKLEFTKMQGAGNDYVYVSCLKQTLPQPEKIAQIVSDRHFGIGGDGLVLILPSAIADFCMRMFNADGSEGKMCGNAIRCVGKYLYDKNITSKKQLSIETLSGVKQLTLFAQAGTVQEVAVEMGNPALHPSAVPVLSVGESVINQPLEVDGVEYHITCVSMGNPHAVVFLPEVATLPLAEIGPGFEHHPLFPERINTEFVRVLSPERLEMRVWERGSGETLACGTGACAAVVAACLNGHCTQGQPVQVQLLGGLLEITWRQDGSVVMRGGATTVFEGCMELDIEKE